MATEQPAAQPLASMGGRHPERYDPDQSANTLMGCEHRGRYLWAAQFVAGRETLDAGCGTGYGLEILAEAGTVALTGIDLSEEALVAAQVRAERSGAQLAQGDLQDLEFPDDSFDVVVCFETIEHLESPELGIAELRRVVRPGGTLLISSPNPDVYPSGNEHHLNELRPEELRGIVAKHFPVTRMYLQQAWLGSIIEAVDPDGSTSEPVEWATRPKIRRAIGPEPDGTTFAVVVGSDAEQAEPSPLINIGNSFDVKWWEDRVAEARQEVEAAENSAASAADAIQESKDALEAKLAAHERESARSVRELEVREAEALERLRETGSALVDANQELAQMPMLKHRLAEMYDRTAGLEGRVNTLLGSRSWRLTSFLRQLAATLRPR
jgi:2-polyprenyl-3-methyl-5-hydroxy-6-metoxy-1,4-benzoquinol methylase